MEAVTGEHREPVTRLALGAAGVPLDDGRARDDVLAPPKPRLPPAAAADARPVPTLFLLTLLSAVDGSLLALAAAGRLTTLADAVTIGLVVVAGAGSWLAANQAFARRRRGHADWALLGLLGVLTLASTLAAAWLGIRLGSALTLHVLPKGAGVVLALVAAEVAGLRLPRAGRLPLPVAGLAAVLVLEVAVQWMA